MIQLWYNLRRERKRLAPRSRFKSKLWKNLDQQWDRSNLQRFCWYQTRVFRLVVSSLSAFVGMLSLSTGVYAYTSSAVTEGTPLYPLKKGIENVEEKIQLTPTAKAQFKLKQLERREAEAKVLKAQNKKLDATVEAIKKTETELEKVEKKLNVTPDSTRLKTKIRMKLEKRKEQLSEKRDALEKKETMFRTKDSKSRTHKEKDHD